MLRHYAYAHSRLTTGTPFFMKALAKTSPESWDWVEIQTFDAILPDDLRQHERAHQLMANSVQDGYNMNYAMSTREFYRRKLIWCRWAKFARWVKYSQQQNEIDRLLVRLDGIKRVRKRKRRIWDQGYP